MLLATAGGGETRQVGSNTVGLPKSRVRWDTAGRLAMGRGGGGGRSHQLGFCLAFLTSLVLVLRID